MDTEYPSFTPFPQTPVTNTQVAYAGFGRRLMALAFDAFILWVVNFFIAMLFGLAIKSTALSLPQDASENITPDSPIAFVQFIISFLQFTFNLCYVIIFTGNKGQTLGKMATGIKIVSLGTKDPPGYGSAFLREVFGKLLSTIPVLLGFVWMLWDEKKQTWHDKIAGTVVIRT